MFICCNFISLFKKSIGVTKIKENKTNVFEHLNIINLTILKISIKLFF